MITVFVPELDALLNEAQQVPSLLARLLGRGQDVGLDPTAAGTELVAGQAVMSAPLTRRVDRPQDAEGIWMRADPVGLIPDLGAVWLQPGARLDPQSSLVAELGALFSENGFDFDLPCAQRGYLRLERLPDCRFTPPWLLAGESMEHALPAGPEQKAWRRLLSEIQVLMHSRGADSGAPGGLWLWGAGELPRDPRPTARVSHLQCQDPALIGAADWLGLSHEPSGADLSPADHTLVEWEAVRERSADANLSALAAWIKPLWRRLKLARISALELAGRERVWQVTPAAAWQFWRRSARS